MRKTFEKQIERTFRRSKHSQPHQGDWSHKRLAEESIRGYVNTSVPINIKERGRIPTHIIKTCERITKTRLPIKPKTYVYRPTKCIRWKNVENYSGMGATQWDVDTKTMDKAVIILPETVYEDKIAREAVLAHEYTELLGEIKGKSDHDSHKTAIKSENAIAKEHGQSRREILERTRKAFKDEYVCKTRKTNKPNVGSLFKNQIKSKNFF